MSNGDVLDSAQENFVVAFEESCEENSVLNGAPQLAPTHLLKLPLNVEVNKEQRDLTTDGLTAVHEVALTPISYTGLPLINNQVHGGTGVDVPFEFTQGDVFEGERITKAHCIECDFFVDLQNTDHCASNCSMKKHYSCSECGELFNFEKNLLAHQILHSLHTFTAGNSCSICKTAGKNRQFKRVNVFEAHIKSHFKNDNLVCNLCSAEFTFSAELNRHKRTVHQRDKEKTGYSMELGYCPNCKNLVEISKLDDHRLLHTLHRNINKKLEKARQTKAISLAAIEGPSITSDPSKKHCCEMCQKAFRRPAELKRHMAVHEKIRKWKCDLCAKSFTHETGLMGHKKAVHSGENPKFKCKICSMVLTKASNLERHVRNSHPLQPKHQVYDCPHCPCQFKTIGALEKHRSRFHVRSKRDDVSEKRVDKITIAGQCAVESSIRREVKAFNCSICGKEYKLRSSLLQHLDLHNLRSTEVSNSGLKCPDCSKVMSSRHALRRHVLLHQNHYKCLDCEQRFPSIHQLDTHRCICITAPKNQSTSSGLDNMQFPTANIQPCIKQKAYFCKKCPMSFYTFKAYKEHKSLHLGLKPHLCWTCHKAFRTTELLNVHKEIHSREPIYCEFCPAILNGRVLYGQHLRIHNRPESNVVNGTFQAACDRSLALASSQSYPVNELNGRELAEGLFQARAQSADFEAGNTRPDDGDWEPLVGTIESTFDRSFRCPVCLHLYQALSHLITHWNNSAEDREHASAVISCPLCQTSLRGCIEAAEHASCVHPYLKTSEVNQVQSTSIPLFEPVSGIVYKVLPASSTKIHACAECSASFSKKSDLTRHYRVHTGERPYVCEVCQRSFSVLSTLECHKRIHSGREPSEKCTICDNKFYSKNALALHLRIHSGDKPLQCRYCSESFRTSATRKTHESSVHGVVQPHRCSKNKKKCRLCVAERSNLPVVKVSKFGKEHQAYTQTETNLEPMEVVLYSPDNQSLSSQKPIVPKYPVKVKKIRIPQRALDNNLIDTLAQISHVAPAQLSLTSSSAFEPSSSRTDSGALTQSIHITARRISITEYSITISRTPPRAIRDGVDTTSSVVMAALMDLSRQGATMRLALMDTQQLNVHARGILEVLGSKQSVTLRARPADANEPCCVELLPPPQVTEFCMRCDICEVDLPTKALSEAHFASEDHETAQVLHPLAGAMQDIHDNLMIPAAIIQPRREDVSDYTCKLCGRKYPGMEPLVAHIRRDHERDHPLNLAPRPAARTAPPLEHREKLQHPV